MIKKHIKKIILIFVGFIILGSVLNWFSNMKYFYEKRYTDYTPIFYGLGIGVNYEGIGYDEEISLDDEDLIEIDLSWHKRDAKDRFDTGIEVYLYGRYINSADPVVVVLNDEVVINKKGRTDDIENFYEDIYLRKLFVFKLNGLYASGENKLLVSTGKTTEEFTIITK